MRGSGLPPSLELRKTGPSPLSAFVFAKRATTRQDCGTGHGGNLKVQFFAFEEKRSSLRLTFVDAEISHTRLPCLSPPLEDSGYKRSSLRDTSRSAPGLAPRKLSFHGQFYFPPVAIMSPSSSRVASLASNMPTIRPLDITAIRSERAISSSKSSETSRIALPALRSRIRSSQV